MSVTQSDLQLLHKRSSFKKHGLKHWAFACVMSARLHAKRSALHREIPLVKFTHQAMEYKKILSLDLVTGLYESINLSLVFSAFLSFLFKALKSLVILSVCIYSISKE